MKLYFMDVFVAEDTPINCAIYTSAMLDILRQMHEKNSKEEARKEMDLIEKLGKMGFEELFRQEMGEDGEAGT